ncbi:MAG TPA: SDR family oxidoreductase, partial [Longimicrobiales bacterium]
MTVAASSVGSLAGRGVLVTGGSMGLGLACAGEALAAGARVVLAARGAETLRQAAEQLSADHPGRVSWVVADVSEPAQVDAMVSSAVERLGRLDGLVHAAAVQGVIGPVLDVDPAEWFDTLRTNLLGSFLVARSAAAAMRQTGGGRIVLFSGGGATGPFPNYTAYACSKAGVVRLAETLAVELSEYGIAVNCIAPGFVATRIHEATLAAGARAGAAYLARTQAQLAEGGVPASLSGRAVVFLLGSQSEGITGRLLAAPWDDWND